MVRWGVRTPINPLEGLKLVEDQPLARLDEVRTPINPLEGLKLISASVRSACSIVRTPINPLEGLKQILAAQIVGHAASHPRENTDQPA